MQKRFTPDGGGVFPEWEEVTLGDILEINPKTEEKIADEFYYADLASINNGVFTHGTAINHNEAPGRAQRVVHIDDVLFQSVNAENLGHYHYTKDKELDKQFVASTGFFLLRMKNGCNAFLYQLLFTKAFNQEVHKYSAGSIYPAVNITEFKKIKVRIPKSIEEQRKIAAALSAYDEMIAVKTAKLETWQECKKRMVKEIFGRTKRFKDDNGREFPEWEEKTLGEISESLKYGMSAAAVKYDGENKYLRITDIDEASRKYVSDKIASPEASKIAEKFLVQQNDLLFARTGASVGKTYLYDETDGKMYYAGYLIKAHIKPEYDSQFIFQLTLTNEFKKWIKKESMRTAQPGINAECLAKYKMMIPCMEEQQKIGSFLAEIDKEIQIQKEFIKTYAEGKRRIMRELMEG